MKEYLTAVALAFIRQLAEYIGPSVNQSAPQSNVERLMAI
jgi:hypothetical protein